MSLEKALGDTVNIQACLKIPAVEMQPKTADD